VQYVFAGGMFFGLGFMDNTLADHEAIFPASIDGIAQLVHLSNGFRIVRGAKPLVAGDVVLPDATH